MQPVQPCSRAAVQPHLRSMALARIALAGDWVERELRIGVGDAAVLPRPVRQLRDHLVAQNLVTQKPG